MLIFNLVEFDEVLPRLGRFPWAGRGAVAPLLSSYDANHPDRWHELNPAKSSHCQYHTLGLNRDGTLKHDYPTNDWRLVPPGEWNWKWNQARSNYSTHDQELVAGYLKSLPEVYGIWHPYKYTVTLLYRQYLPMIACLLLSHPTTETSVLLHRKVPLVEKLVAALLVARSGFIVQIQDIITPLEAQRKLHPPAAVVALHKVKALQRMLTVYYPAIFALGHGVRELPVGMQEYWDKIECTPGFA